MLKNMFTYFLRVKKLFKYFLKSGFGAFVHVSIRYLTAPFEVILSLLPKEGRLLDFGCGHGLFESLIDSDKSHLQITGVDIDANKIEIAQSLFAGNNNFSFSTQDIDTLPEQQFDVIVTLDVIYLIPFEQQLQLFKKFNRLLKKGGVLLVKTQDPALKLKMLVDRFEEFLAVKILRITKTNQAGHFYFIKDLSELKQDLVSLGFAPQEIVVHKGFLHPHVLVKAIKQ